MIVGAEYGPLAKLVGLVACASSAGWAILASFRGRAKWEPSQESLPNGPRQVAGAGTALFVTIIWVTLNKPEDDVVLIRLGATTFALSLFFLLFYRFLIPVYTYTKQVVTNTGTVEAKVLGGLWRKKEAAKGERRQKITTQEYFKRVRYEEDKVWSRPARELANAFFAIAYIGVTICGALALTCGGMRLFINNAREKGAPSGADVIVDQAMLELKAENWSKAVELFDKALEIEPPNQGASNGIWQALTEGAGLALSDRAYVWPKGGLLVSVAEKAPLVLMVANANTTSGRQPSHSYCVYNYESGNTVPICEVPNTSYFPWQNAGFDCEDQCLVIPQDKPEARLFAFNDSGAWEVSSRPGGCVPRNSSPTFKVPDNGVVLSRDATGRHVVYSDSKGIHIYDLVAKREVCGPLPGSFGSIDLSASGRVLGVRQSSLTEQLRAALQQRFVLWILPENSGWGRTSFDGNFRLEFQDADEKKMENVYIRQREPGQVFHLGKQPRRIGYLRWQFHPRRDELYLEAGNDLCIFNLPTMPYFLGGAAPAFPGIPPGKSIHRFLRLNRQETAVTLCRERDELHGELVADETLPMPKKHFADMPEAWRNLLEWWTTKPGQRKPWR
jgi:hypothetical protein